MKILLVGCGAVGQVLGVHLQQAGVELGLLDKPEKLERFKQALAQGGLPVFELNRAHAHDPLPHRLEKYQVLESLADCLAFMPDQIWFAIPSPVYYSAWYRNFLQQVHSERVVCFAPEGRRSEFVPSGMENRLVFGGITFMAWQGDLEGGGGQADAVNFCQSPLGLPLEGNPDACRTVRQVLRQAGFKVSISRRGSRSQATTTALMTAFVAGLELSGWKLAGFRSNAWLGRSASAARQAILGQNRHAGIFMRLFTLKPFLTVGFFLTALFLPLLVPFDIEKYLRFHYTKTHDQTVNLLEVFDWDAQYRGLSVDAIRSLLAGLRAAG